MFLEIHSENPQARYINNVVECLNEGGIIIFPTDTVYALGCSIHQHKAVERIARMKGIKIEKANFSFLCNNLSNISEYARQINNDTFRLMKKVLPGPYTFILNASSNVPKIFDSKKRTIGIRVPDNKIVQTILSELGHPLMSTSLHSDDDDYFEYVVDAGLIYEKYANQVDLTIDGGPGDIEPSTVLDCTGEEIIVVRQGKGSIDFL